MPKLLAAALAALLVSAIMPAAAADGPGTCGKGKKWNPDTQKCEKKPRGSPSGSHS